MARNDFDPTTIKPDGRPPAKAQLFDGMAPGPRRGSVNGEALGGPVTVLAYGNDTPGEGPRLHVHPYDETFVVTEGRARFFVGDQVIEAAAGEVVLGRRVCRTDSRTSGRGGCRRLTSTTRPAGFRPISRRP